MGKNKKYIPSAPKYWESDTGKNDNFGRVHESLVKSHAYQKLKPQEKVFYLLCRVQAETETGRQCLYNAINEQKLDLQDTGNPHKYFVFPASHMDEYGIDRYGGCRALKALENAGFIKVVANNKHRFKVNVYEFSDEWKCKL